MMLMMQNLGSNPNRSCNTTTAVVITNGFLYLRMDVPIAASSILHQVYTRPFL